MISVTRAKDVAVRVAPPRWRVVPRLAGMRVGWLDGRDGRHAVSLTEFFAVIGLLVRKCHDPRRRYVEAALAMKPSSSSIGNLRAVHSVRPPWSRRTRVTPLRLSASAARALVTSSGQEQ